MPSSKKTEHMGLNQFIGSDHPKMEDFNFDNTQIDQKFQEHIASQLHLSEQDRQTLLAAKFVIGSYSGNNEAARKIATENAAFGLVFAVGEPLSYTAASGGVTYIYGGMFTPQGSSKGISWAQDGFSVQQMSANPPDGKKCALNQQGKTYFYILFPQGEQKEKQRRG